MIPECRYCRRPMQLNTAMSTPTVQQYICGCQGFIYYVNTTTAWKPPLELRRRKDL